VTEARKSSGASDFEWGGGMKQYATGGGRDEGGRRNGGRGDLTKSQSVKGKIDSPL